MKLEKSEKHMMFSTTQIPDIFFSEYLGNMPGDYLKIYLYLSFLSKYSKEVKVNDLSKNLVLPFNVINEGMKYLEDNHLILRKPSFQFCSHRCYNFAHNSPPYSVTYSSQLN